MTSTHEFPSIDVELGLALLDLKLGAHALACPDKRLGLCIQLAWNGRVVDGSGSHRVGTLFAAKFAKLYHDQQWDDWSRLDQRAQT